MFGFSQYPYRKYHQCEMYDISKYMWNGWELLQFRRFGAPTHCRVGLCCLFQPNSLKTIPCSRLREMWHRNPVATFASLAHCSGLLRSSSLLMRGFIRSWGRQHWFDCPLENGSGQICLVFHSNRRPFSFLLIDQQSKTSWPVFLQWV